MTDRFTNLSNVDLALAVFLADDDYQNDMDGISVTSLIKSIRQIILIPRVDQSLTIPDVISQVDARMGQAIHTGIEHAWKINHVKCLKALGYSQSIVDRVVINPVDGEELAANAIKVYLENRNQKTFEGKIINGAYDIILDGVVGDHKITKTYAYISGSNDEKYILQGSIYRWLNPDKITADYMHLHFMFKDWKRSSVGRETNYPPSPVLTKSYKLLSIEQTEDYMRKKFAEIEKYIDAEDKDIPLCNAEELWQKDPHWKYYANKDKTSRSTKNFAPADFGSEAAAKGAAYARYAKDGSKGLVVHKPGEVVACKYCAAFSICEQKDALIAQGSLIL